MDVMADQNFDLFGHNFLDTIDLDIMEQTIIDDVMAEITVSEEIAMSEPLVSRCRSEPVVTETPIPRTKSEPILKNVIEAVDVEGLLEQFEEASQCLDSKAGEESKTEVPVFTLDTPVQQSDTKDKNGNVEKKELFSDILQKLKSANKPKSTVMLPMMVPAKRGRGRAMTRGHPVALPANCTPRRLQRVMMQNSELKDIIALEEPDKNTDSCNNAENRVVSENKVVSENEVITEIEVITENKVVSENKVITENDKDEKVNEVGAEVKKKEDNSNADQNYFEQLADHDYFRSVRSSEPSCDTKESEIDNEMDIGLEEGEIFEDDMIKGDRSKSHENSHEDHGNPAQFFDKLPSYYTALSIPRKQVKKTASCVTRRGGITVHDYFERDISPIRDTSTYSKLPEYCSSFTNSTRYDSLVNEGSQKSNDGSKASSGYSSLTHSPDLSVRPSRSRSHSRSMSRSVSRSRTAKRNYRQRRSSYSSDSRCSSSSSCSSCSGSVCSNSSCCGSTSRSGSCDSLSSSSCSTCGSRSSSMSSRSPSRSISRSPTRSPARSPTRSPTRSPERSWRRERDFRSRRSRRSQSRRGQRSTPKKRRSRSRSRLNSYSRSRSRDYRSRSRSRSRLREIQRARDESLERWKDERKKQREEEKEQQMRERRIVYVGGLPSSYSRHQLKDHFSKFGPIENVQLHFREHGDNYGFVTFRFTCDAYAAIEKGNKVPGLQKFDLCFGGRRQFCDVEYADLDGNKEIEEEYDSKLPGGGNLDFDELLRRAKAGIKK